MKYVVFKTEDVPEYMQEEFVALMYAIKQKRFNEGKTIDHKYFVINTDEPYADEIREIIKREHGDCCV